MNKDCIARNNFLHRALMLLLVACFSTSLFGQTTTVSGKVFDSSGTAPLEGVSVTVKGTKTTTATSADGKFTIAATPGQTLLFSYVQYDNVSHVISGQEDILIRMPLKSKEMADVVVVGYGQQKKVSVVAAISSMKATGLLQTPASNIGVALAGRLPGLTVLQRSGIPGSETIDFYIRGRSTINEQRPLLMVDGVERDFSALDPHEIATISILKDASATAVYGVRGANGVIMVTTRRGVAGKPVIDVTMETSRQSPTRMPDMVSAYDYAVLRNQVAAQSGNAPEYSDYELERYRLGDKPDLYPVRDYVGEFTQTAPMHRININVSGGSEKMRYFTTVGYLYQEGLFKTEKFDEYNYDPKSKASRVNFRSNFDIDLNPSLKMFLNISGYMQKKNDPIIVPNNPSYYDDANAYSVMLASLVQRPNLASNDLTPDDEVLSSSKFALGGTDNVPYGMLNRTGFRNTMTSQITTTLGAEQRLDFITKGLYARAIVSYDANSVNTQRRERTFAVYDAVRDPDSPDSLRYERLGSSVNSPLVDAQIQSFTNLFNLEASLNYSRTFRKHDVGAMLLYNQYQRVINIQLPYNYIGFVGRATYRYNSRYMAEVNFGYNGSEQFAPSQRFGFFPSFSAGWILSEENFMKDYAPWMDFMKLRASYGKVGNDRMGASRFLYIENWGTGGSGWSGLPDGTVQRSIANPNISWEVNNKYNVGIETRFLRNFSLDIDLFYEIRNNILTRSGTTPTGIFGTGAVAGNGQVSLPPLNEGRVENRGFEVVAGYTATIGNDLRIIINANGAYNRNKVLYMGEVLLPEDYAVRQRSTGYRLGQMFGYETAGFFNTQRDLDTWYDQTPLGAAPKLGDLKYVDKNGDNKVDERDMVPIGNPNVPEWNYGAAVSLAYKGFDLSVMFQGTAVRGYYLSGTGIWETANFNEWHKEAWTQDKYDNGEKITYPRLDPGSTASKQTSDFWLADGTYIRLKNVELGYTFPRKLSQKIGASKIRLYANSLNPLTWDRYPVKYYDPELSSNLTYPIFKAYNFGLNISF
ncbi:SusC/RagA family TonB-linked outer membrane protein [Flavihumibacter petaseus]|nr:TonB-dependent receptor [Flavihumibacter petaseus]